MCSTRTTTLYNAHRYTTQTHSTRCVQPAPPPSMRHTGTLHKHSKPDVFNPHHRPLQHKPVHRRRPCLVARRTRRTRCPRRKGLRRLRHAAHSARQIHRRTIRTSKQCVWSVCVTCVSQMARSLIVLHTWASAAGVAAVHTERSAGVARGDHANV